MDASPPNCPDCSSNSARPIVYGEPGPDLAGLADRGALVLGSCVVGGSDPAWDCPDCGCRFGESRESGSKLVTRTRTEWTKVIRTMLPRPVKVNENGELVGGKPPVVVVRLSENAIEVMEAGIDWDGVLPAWKPRPFAAATFEAPAAEVATLIARAWGKRVSRYRWCPRCRRTIEPEHMLRGKAGVCQGCATKYFGVVF